MSRIIVSVLVLYDEEQAVKLGGDHARNVRILNDRNDLAVGDFLESWPDNDHFYVKQGTRRAGVLLKQHGEPDDNTSLLYDLLYRSESTFGGHGLGIVTPYVDGLTEPLTLRPRPGPINASEPGVYLILSIVCTVILARHVFDAFGISFADVNEIGDRLLAVMREDSGDENEGPEKV